MSVFAEWAHNPCAETLQAVEDECRAQEYYDSLLYEVETDEPAESEETEQGGEK